MEVAFSEDQLKRLGETRDPHAFLTALLEMRKALGQPLSYSALSQRAGFASRNFAREVALGKKRLSVASAKKFSRALKLKPVLTRYFVLLTEHALTPVNSAERSKLEDQLQNCRERLRRTSRSGDSAGQKLYAVDHAVKVYAALGSRERGATLKEILQRTSLDEGAAAKALDFLKLEGFVARNQSRFFASERHLSFTNLGKESAFKELYLRSLSEVEAKAQKTFEDKTQLYFQACYSIPQHKLAELNDKLHELLVNYIDETEEPNGDKVVTLVCGLVS